jgi:hypothetical protein
MAASAFQPPIWTKLFKHSVKVYSAHWDVRRLHGLEPPFVRIFTYSLNTSELRALEFQCRFFFPNASTVLVPGIVIEHEKTELSDDAFFVLCPADKVAAQGMQVSRDAIPISVTLLCSGCYSEVAYQVCLVHMKDHILSPADWHNA